MKSILRNPEMLVAIAALLSSFLSLFFYIKQTRIMEEQQKASAWPHLEWSYSNGDDFFQFDVKNKGVGPASVKYVWCAFDEKAYDSVEELIYDVLNKDYNHDNSGLMGRVVSPQENVRVLKMYDKTEAKAIADSLMFSKSNRFQFRICYESIYHDKFISTGFDSYPCKRCDSLTVANFNP